MDDQRVPYKRITIDEISDEGALNLAGAIVREEVVAYEGALRSGRKESIEIHEKFFKSRYFSNLTGLNGQAIIDKVKRYIQEEKDQ